MILSKNVINKKYENVRVIPQTYRKIPPPPSPFFNYGFGFTEIRLHYKSEKWYETGYEIKLSYAIAALSRSFARV